jgi:hypothetical protein
MVAGTGQKFLSSRLIIHQQAPNKNEIDASFIVAIPSISADQCIPQSAIVRAPARRSGGSRSEHEREYEFADDSNG